VTERAPLARGRPLKSHDGRGAVNWNGRTFIDGALAVALAATMIVGWVTESAHAQNDPLLSWNEGPAKQAIVEFVRTTTTQGSPKFVPPAERIATFDQDGTLGCRTRCTRRWSIA
jgi:hypothetical protein